MIMSVLAQNKCKLLKSELKKNYTKALINKEFLKRFLQQLEGCFYSFIYLYFCDIIASYERTLILC